MIEKLTPEQEARLPEIRDEWLAIGLSTEPARRPEAEAAVVAAYKTAGLPVPAAVYWESSPLAGVRKLKEIAPGEYWSNAVVYGNEDASFLAWISVFREFGMAGLEKIDAAAEVARNAGWWFPLDEAVIITDRPEVLLRDPQNRLHCEDGMALRYRDGWGLYSWHGTRVPADLIEGSWGTERIMTEGNAEIRRCAIEKKGWETFILESGMRKVAEDADPGNPGQAIALYDLPEALADLYGTGTHARILLCVNGTAERDGTRRKFALPVPGAFSDPVAAAASLYGWPAEEYRQLARRA